jgi:hypothetical protein
LGEFRVVLHENETLLLDPTPDERVRDRPGSRPEFDDRPGYTGIDKRRHGLSQILARRRDSASQQRSLDPGAQEPGFILETFTTEQSLPRAGFCDS